MDGWIEIQNHIRESQNGFDAEKFYTVTTDTFVFSLTSTCSDTTDSDCSCYCLFCQYLPYSVLSIWIRTLSKEKKRTIHSSCCPWLPCCVSCSRKSLKLWNECSNDCSYCATSVPINSRKRKKTQKTLWLYMHWCQGSNLWLLQVCWPTRADTEMMLRTIMMCRAFSLTELVKVL